MRRKYRWDWVKRSLRGFSRWGKSWISTMISGLWLLSGRITKNSWTVKIYSILRLSRLRSSYNRNKSNLTSLLNSSNNMKTSIKVPFRSQRISWRASNPSRMIWGYWKPFVSKGLRKGTGSKSTKSFLIRK